MAADNPLMQYIPIMFATCAYIFGASGLVNCFTVEFPKLEDSTFGPDTIYAGLFGYKTKAAIQFEGEVWIVDTCRGYSDMEERLGFEYESDGRMEMIQNMVIAICVIGGITVLGTCVFPVFPLGPTMWKGYGICFLIVCILQGVTLLVLDSAVCQNNPLLQFLEQELPEVWNNYPETCQKSTGYRMALTATVFWGLAGLSVLAINVSTTNNENQTPNGMPESERKAVEEDLKGSEKEKTNEPKDSEEEPEEIPAESSS